MDNATFRVERISKSARRVVSSFASRALAAAGASPRARPAALMLSFSAARTKRRRLSVSMFISKTELRTKNTVFIRKTQIAIVVSVLQARGLARGPRRASSSGGLRRRRPPSSSTIRDTCPIRVPARRARPVTTSSSKAGTSSPEGRGPARNAVSGWPCDSGCRRKGKRNAWNDRYAAIPVHQSGIRQGLPSEPSEHRAGRAAGKLRQQPGADHEPTC